MKRIFRNIVLWVYIKLHTLMIAIGVALFNTEQEILKADPDNLKESNKHVQRMRHRNQLLEKFYAGQTDEKYVQEYYEVLKKADKFIRTATPHQMAVAADKYGTSYGMKDKWGRRYEHYGFFDDKHKHTGKTLGEVLAQEFEERRTKDDDLEIMYIFNNHPVEVGLKDVWDAIGEKTKQGEVIIRERSELKNPYLFPISAIPDVNDNKIPSYVKPIGFDKEVLDVVDINKASNQVRFPISAVRDNEKAINKIEELTEFIHVKKIGFEYRQLEFFVPLHFKTSELDDNSDVFREIIDIKQIYIRDEYGELFGFNINNFIKRIIYNDTHEVLKFDGIEMQVMDGKT
jgi:hypothetical protein